nr:hypothetical protein [Clostridia bacterium]
GVELTKAGFNSTPTITQIGGIDVLAFSTVGAGTLYYYYSQTSTVPTSSTNFMAAYSTAKNLGVGSSINVPSADRQTTTLLNSSMLTLYPYIVFMFQATGGTYYDAYAVSRGSTANASASGFTTVPSVMHMGTADMISFTPLYSGNLKFYYTNSSTTPTAAEFASVYSQSINANVPYNYAPVTAGESFSRAYSANPTFSTYKYVVFQLDNYQPYVVERTVNTTNATATGFYTTPSVSVSTTGGKDSIIATTIGAGYILFYYTNTPTQSVTAADFNTIYALSPYRGSVITSGYGSTTLETDIVSSSVSSMYNYVVMMFVSGTQTYTPVVTYRSTSGNSSSSSGSVSGNGFTSKPSLSTDDNDNRRITFTAGVDGDLLYFYYSSSSDAPDTPLEFLTIYNTTSNVKGSIDVTAGVSIREPLEDSSLSKIAIMLVKDDGQTMYDPIILNN